MYLMYSPLFGLREVDRLPPLVQIMQGTCLRDAAYQNGITEVTIESRWNILVLCKNRYGRNIDKAWVYAAKNELPHKLRAEALLLGIEL